VIEHQFGIEILPIWHDKPGDAEGFIRDVRTELAKVLLSRTGRCLAGSLRFHQTQPTKQPILVMPYEENDCNAIEDGRTRGSSQSVVLFTPATRASGCSAGKPATLPHEILFHELVHSLRRVSGHLHKNFLNNKLGLIYHDTEEFLAILVTNIFISDMTNPHKTSLRAGTYGHGPLEPELADSFRFFSLGTPAFNIIANFCNENPGFTRMLTTVAAHCNPIAAYYKNPHKAFEMAANGDAENVVEGMTPLDYVRNGGVWERIIPYGGPGPKLGAP
jgi:hypothetical protein